MTQQDETRLGEINALLGRGTEYEGKLCFEGRVRIDGKFRGDIHSDDLLILGDGADVDGRLHVGTLIVRGGVLRGKVYAAQLVELFAPARVHADIETPLFFVDRGVVFDGRCVMGGNDTELQPLDDRDDRKRLATSPGTLVVDSERAVPVAPRASEDDAMLESAESSSGDTEAVVGDRDAESEGTPEADGEAKPKRKRARKSRP